MKTEIHDLNGPEIAAFLEDHIKDMKKVSPPESKHALDLDGLRAKDITFWVIRDGDSIVGCGALKALDKHHGEIKSMRTLASLRGKGIASTLLTHIINEATQRGYRMLSLETGSMPFFEPARRLYARFGFVSCAPFADYVQDPNSVFMRLEIPPNFHTNRVTPTGISGMLRKS